MIKLELIRAVTELAERGILQDGESFRIISKIMQDPKQVTDKATAHMKENQKAMKEETTWRLHLESNKKNGG